MLKKLIATFGVVAAGLAFAPAASATVVIDVQDPASQQYQQTTNSPCVIGENSCQNPDGFDQTLINKINDGGSYHYSETSPEYTVGQIYTVINGSYEFIVGVDLNTANIDEFGNASENLDLFAIDVCTTTDENGCAGVWETIYLIEDYGPLLAPTSNGNGYSDILLYADGYDPFDLSGYDDSDLVRFRVVVNNGTDGLEQFFLVNANSPPPTVPEPSVLGLLGAGLLGLGVVGRRRRRKAA
ncbi:MAG: PEP-CTERM sorting domain-containing protein [Alphaproteobacteria bacterium]|nr:MAG: PEP-CTERM sorting domain-containing protein [Alphaproteobacteria bacterium]